ncbi:MAG TPA: MFS transporter [Ktedonobacteraceae bacterium]
MHIRLHTSPQRAQSRPGEAGASGAERENLTVSRLCARLTPADPPQEEVDRQVPVSSGARPSPSYRRWFQLFTVVVGTFMAMLDAFVVNVAIPSISRGLRTSLSEVELVIASYILVYAVLLVTGGRLGDRFGHKRMFLLGVTGFTLASVCCALAPSVSWLIGARVLQGASAALLYPQALSIIQVTFSGRERAVALGIYGSALPVAAVMGQVGGGLLLQANILDLTWRPVFLINVPIGILTLVAAALFLERQRTAASVRLDGEGIALITVALLLLVVPLVSGRDAGWPWWMLLMLAASLPALVLFALFEQRLAKRGGSPLVKLALFKQRAFTVGNLIALTFFSCNAGMAFVFTVFLQVGLGFSPLQAGLVFVPSAIGTFVAALLGPRLIPKLGRSILMLGCFAQGFGLLVMLVIVLYSGTTLSGLTLAPVFFIMGAGSGLGVAPLVGTITSGVARQDAGTASGVVSTIMQVSNVLGVAVVGLIFLSILNVQPISESQPVRYVLALGWTLPFLAALAFISGSLVGLLPRTKIGKR